jgi:hypothetical protein
VLFGPIECLDQLDDWLVGWMNDNVLSDRLLSSASLSTECLILTLSLRYVCMFYSAAYIDVSDSVPVETRVEFRHYLCWLTVHYT